MYGSVLQSTSAPWRTCWGGMPWVMSMISASGAIRLMTPWQVPTKSSCRPKSERKVMTTRGSLNAGGCDRGDEAVEIVRLSLADHLDPLGPCFSGGLGADRDRRPGNPKGSVGPRGRGRGQHEEIALRERVRPQRPGAVEDDRVGAELVGEVGPGVLGAGEEDPPGLPRELRDEAFLRRDAGDERRFDPVLAKGRGRAGPDRGDRRELAAAPAGQLARGARTGDDDPVVAGGVDGLRADRLDLDQRAEHGRVPERLDPLRELPGLLGRPRDDDAQAPGSGSHP